MKGRGVGRGGDRRSFDRDQYHQSGPPEHVIEMGTFLHPCISEMVYKSTNEKVPKFNSSVFLENKQEIGKVDEIFGPINESMFTVKPAAGVAAASFKPGDKVYIAPFQLLPMHMFLEENNKGGGKPAGGRGGSGGRGGGRGFGGRGGGRGFGGRGGSGGRGGGGRGGFGGRGGGNKPGFGAAGGRGVSKFGSGGRGFGGRGGGR